MLMRMRMVMELTTTDAVDEMRWFERRNVSLMNIYESVGTD